MILYVYAEEICRRNINCIVTRYMKMFIVILLIIRDPVL